MTLLTVTINERKYSVELIHNETSQAFIEQLPLSLNMDDLHRNEKYCILDSPLPTEPKKVNQIQAGDVMLYGKDCIVLFYKSFKTTYSYTPIGRIEENLTVLDHPDSSNVTIEAK